MLLLKCLLVCCRAGEKLSEGLAAGGGGNRTLLFRHIHDCFRHRKHCVRINCLRHTKDVLACWWDAAHVQHTAKTEYRKFETNIPRKGIVRPQFSKRYWSDQGAAAPLQRLTNQWVACTKKRGNTENSKQIFPEKELCELSVPIFTLTCLRAIYIFPWSVCLFCCRKIGGQILGIYNIAHRHMNVEIGTEQPRNS